MTQTIRAIFDSIEHHRRMLSWAKMQNPNSKIWALDMKKAIGETYGAADCPLCCIFTDKLLSNCGECPVNKKYGSCTQQRNNANFYRKISLAQTCGEFIEAEKLFIPQLESLIDDCIEALKKPFEREHDHFAEEDLTRICTDCGVITKQGTSKNPKAKSHGLCQSCAEKKVYSEDEIVIIEPDKEAVNG